MSCPLQRRRRQPKWLGITVAGYPETHQQAKSPEADLENLKRKVAAAGHCVITQLFFDNRDFFRFRDRCRELAIDVPSFPGILSLTNLTQIQRITSLCKAKLPPDFLEELNRKTRQTGNSPSVSAGPPGRFKRSRLRRPRHPLLCLE